MVYLQGEVVTELIYVVISCWVRRWREGGGRSETLDAQKSLYWLSYGATLSGIGCWALSFSKVPKLKALNLDQSLKPVA